MTPLPLCQIADLIGASRRMIYYHVKRTGLKPVATEKGGHLRGRTRGLYDVEAVRWAYAGRKNSGPRKVGVDYGDGPHAADPEGDPVFPRHRWCFR